MKALPNQKPSQIDKISHVELSSTLIFKIYLKLKFIYIKSLECKNICHLRYKIK
jgi:hypothetical protein